jgi:phosphatidylglycerophosphatase A
VTFRLVRDRFALALGTGLGTGFLRPAPGTWGSLVGFAYFAALLRCPLFVAAAIAAAVILLAVWSAGESARLLAKKDPGEVVIDEIAAIPLAAWPLALAPAAWPWWLAAFALWRVMDIAKPSPARQLEKLPGGWGIVADDLMSALYSGGGLWLARLAAS